MQVVFVGGGSFRTLPIVRAAMADGVTLRGGTIRLVDLNLERAETVGRLIMRTPEFAGSDCRVQWSANLDEALPGADVVSVSFPVGSRRVCQLSEVASEQYGFHGSDQLSLSGAFRSLTGGVILLDIARRMERHCPSAWLVDHANPVAVYSGLVNNHTGIKALGLCGSVFHPRWELTRLLYEQDAYREDYTYALAGVNHLAFLLRGEHQGRDVYAMLDEKYGDRAWTPQLPSTAGSTLAMLHFSYRLLRKMRRSFGVMAGSNEIEGPRHVFPDEYAAPDAMKLMSPTTLADVDDTANADAARQKADRRFQSASRAGSWTPRSGHDPHTTTRCSAFNVDPTAIVLKALGSNTPQWLGASLPCHGAVKGFKDRHVLEYSFTLSRSGLQPDRELEVPDCVHGLISALSCHQTLLGDAIATRDPKLLSDALYAYPHHQSMASARALWQELLQIHAAEIPAEFQQARDYFV